MGTKQILLLYVEPTPYALALIERLRSTHDGTVHVLFLGTNMSQNWQIPLKGGQYEVLPAGNRTAKQRIRSLLQSGEFAAIHLAGWGHNLLRSAMLTAWRLGIPSLVESDTPIPSRVPLWKRVAKAVLYPQLFQLPALFLPAGTRQAQYLHQYGVHGDRIRVVQMTVDTREIAARVDAVSPAERNKTRAHFGIAPDAVAFLYVGRLEPYKGIRTLIDAFKAVRATGLSVHLLMVGDGTLRAEMDKLAETLPDLSVTGRLSGTSLLDAYAAGDVFTLPSSFEPWGLVVNEALAAGLPVVASDRVGCVDDLVIDGHSGLVVPADNSGCLAKSMATLAREPDLRLKLAQGGRKLAEHWTLEEESARIASAWMETIGAPRSGAWKRRA